jgi:hypothetical protein
MALLGGIETADYYNFKMLCAYVNQARNYLLLVRKELGEVPNVSYAPINWFNKVNLNLYAKDPARDGNDPILSNMKTIAPYPGRTSFSMGGPSMFSVLKYSNDTGCTPHTRKGTRKGNGNGNRNRNRNRNITVNRNGNGTRNGNNLREGGGILDTLFKVVRVAETAAYVVDRVAFYTIDQIFNAYRWYLLEYMRLAEIQSNPCVRHDYIMTTLLRTSGKIFRGKGAFRQLDDPIINALLKARPSFPPYKVYLKEVDTMSKTQKGGTRRRVRKIRRHSF